jgi:hypothetical protein
LRKLRFARSGGGKRGGYRTIYVFFGGADVPLFLITVFAKNEKDNLGKAEQDELIVLGKTLLARYGERQ